MLRILGEEFYKKNKSYGYYVYKNQKLKLEELIETKNINEDKFKIKIIFNKIIYDKSYMFKDCVSLIALTCPKTQENIDNLIDAPNLIDSYAEKNNLCTFNYDDFYGNEVHPTISTISLNYEGSSDGSSLFYFNNNLKCFEYNNKNIFNLKQIFKNCVSLISISDLSYWNINNVIDINEIFVNCSSLEVLPDISYWKTDKLTDIGSSFRDCTLLKSLPDISKWNKRNVTNMNAVFYNCKSLISLPDISKWDTSNVTILSSIFANCESLKNMPDISKWNTKNIINMYGIFYNCNSLISMPDITN